MRPTKPQEEIKDAPVQILFTNSERERVRSFCKKMGFTVSKWGHEVIMKALKKV